MIIVTDIICLNEQTVTDVSIADCGNELYNLDFTTDYLTDDCKPFSYGKNAILFLNSDNILAEIELFDVGHKPISNPLNILKEIIGTPQLKIVNDDFSYTKCFYDDKKVLLSFDENVNSKFLLRCSKNNFSYLIFEHCLVGMEFSF